MIIVGDKMNEEEKTVEIAEASLDNKCPTCTASLKYNAKLKKFKCEYCGEEFTIEDLKKHSDSAATQKANEAPKTTPAGKDNYNSYVSYKCESCGAEIVADEQTAATFCVYCGNTAILRSKLSGNFQPSRVIPFEKPKEDAIKAFKSLSKGRALVPKDFSDEKNIEKIRGVYIPFRLYDYNVEGSLNMKGTKVSSWTVGDNTYTKTDIYNVVRGGNAKYNCIPVDASTRFDNDIMNTIEPFDYNKLVPYNHAYLSGFLAEKYDEEDDITKKEAEERAINSTNDFFKGAARGYTTLTATETNLVPKQEKMEYVLLPVWMVNVKYKNKMYIFAMNGESGEFIGNIPVDIGKAFLYAIIIFIVCIVVASIASFVIWYMGGM